MSAKRTEKRTKRWLQPKALELCDKCGQQTDDPKLECPGCGVWCCQERCIGGVGVKCFECEEHPDAH